MPEAAAVALNSSAMEVTEEREGGKGQRREREEREAERERVEEREEESERAARAELRRCRSTVTEWLGGSPSASADKPRRGQVRSRRIVLPRGFARGINLEILAWVFYSESEEEGKKTIEHTQ